MTPGPQTEADRQRWRFEQQLWLLLPPVLLPAANSLLNAGTPADPTQQELQDLCVDVVFETCGRAPTASSNLHHWLAGQPGEDRAPHPDWMGRC
jgi:hypothetical protein